MAVEVVYGLDGLKSERLAIEARHEALCAINTCARDVRAYSSVPLFKALKARVFTYRACIIDLPTVPHQRGSRGAVKYQ